LNNFLAIGAAVVPNGNYRGLVEHNTLAPDINKRIGSPKVNCHIAGEVTTKKSEHGRSVLSEMEKKHCNSDALPNDNRCRKNSGRIKPTMITYNSSFTGRN